MNNRAVPLLAATACLGILFTASPADASDHVRPVCTIVGTAGDDVLQGTPGNDVICGLGGDDIIIGGLGDDVLVGDSGDDLLVGGPGSDRLYAGDGEDQLVDSGARGTVDGGDGTDLCVAVSGSTTRECERLFTRPGTNV
ncbi:MAG TPA: hypothetical protein VF755_07805 [Catenuloplanes sp.]|jgi:Ca2+-binding RTX toxin-like protein